MCHTSTRSVAVARVPASKNQDSKSSTSTHSFIDEVRDGRMRPTSSGGPFCKDLTIIPVLTHWCPLQRRMPRPHIYICCMSLIPETMLYSGLGYRPYT